MKKFEEDNWPGGPYSTFFGAYAKIYSLSDEKGNVFYVGCTGHQMSKRLQSHISEAKSNHNYTNQRKNNFIRSLDYKVVATVLDMVWVTGRKCTDALGPARDIEKEWIDKYTSLGYDLCNAKKRTNKIHIKEPEHIGQVFKFDGKAVKEAKISKAGDKVNTTV